MKYLNVILLYPNTMSQLYFTVSHFNITILVYIVSSCADAFKINVFRKFKFQQLFVSLMFLFFIQMAGSDKEKRLCDVSEI